MEDTGDAQDASSKMDEDENNESEDQTTACTAFMPSSNRTQRNMAEKMRRDKLNSYINNLATEVPMVSNSPKRMDKTSVLRLSATFLRLHNLINSTKEEALKLPEFFSSINWMELLLGDMVMLITTSAGKIIYLTDNIEKIVGHTQTELTGQTLFMITCPEDHAELKKCLTPNDVEESSADTDVDCDDVGATSSESASNSSCSARLCTSRCNSKKSQQSNSSSSSSVSSSSTEYVRQRRSFYLRLKQRCPARSEQPQYELVHVQGCLKIPKKIASQTHKKSRKHKVDLTTTNSNDILLVAVLKPFREKRVTEISLMEATRDEYITRHHLDGRIVYSDHRISTVSGYLAKEVSGLQAFCFMHKDDVRWVLIALRQMYWRGESYGSSCYRLKSKTGEFIYLKTHGYLELNANNESYASFICVNTLVSTEEGEREIKQMRRRFSALIESKVEPGIVAIAKDHCLNETEADHIQETEDPMELKNAIKAMISNIPMPALVHEDPQKSREMQFAKAKLMSKALPPVLQSNSANIVTVVEDKSPKSISMSPQPLSTSVSSAASQPSTPTSLTPNSPSVPSSHAMQNRPSVLRLASGQPITVYNEADNNVAGSTSSSECEQEAPAELERSISNCHVKQELIKEETSETDDVESMLSSAIANFVEKENAERKVVIMRRSGAKRHFDSEPIFSSVPIKKSSTETSICEGELSYVPGSMQSDRMYDKELSKPYTVPSKCSTNSMSPSPPTDNFTRLESLEDCDATFGLDINSFEQKAEPVQMLDLLGGSNKKLRNNHIALESRMQMQNAQISAIKGDLDGVPYTNERRFYLENDLGKLKVRL